MGLKVSVILNIIFLVIISMMYVSNQIEVQEQRLDLQDMQTTETLETSTEALKPPIKEELEVCSQSTFKSYMPYQAITNKNSKQWELQKLATTESAYGLRMINGYFMVAVTKKYGEVGDLLEVDFEGGSMLAVIGDIKSAGHNDCQSLIDTSIIEFIVDNNKLHSEIRKHGDLNILFKGSIKSIYNLGSYQ